MFTGIIEDTGQILDITYQGSNTSFKIKSTIASELKIDQSVAHNGICLTVVEQKDDWHIVTAIQETLDLTTAKNWKIGDLVNLERATILQSRLDGHLVQGHVDSYGHIVSIINEDGSWRFKIQFKEEFAALLISKGSICIDGVSLTVISPTKNEFEVAIIPYTYENTVFQNYKVDQNVNLEFDLIGKYILRSERLRNGQY